MWVSTKNKISCAAELHGVSCKQEGTISFCTALPHAEADKSSCSTTAQHSTHSREDPQTWFIISSSGLDHTISGSSPPPDCCFFFFFFFVCGFSDLYSLQISMKYVNSYGIFFSQALLISLLEVKYNIHVLQKEVEGLPGSSKTRYVRQTSQIQNYGETCFIILN